MKIGLLTPSYNQGSYIGATIESVLSQTRSVDYYQIRDSCSTDQTPQVISSFAEKSAIVRLFVKKDKGQADALNQGFAAFPSDIEIMGYINSDDLLVPDALECVLKIFEENPDVSIVSGERWLMGPRSRKMIRTPIVKMEGEDAYSGISLFQEGTFWRRSLYEKAGNKIDDSLRFAMDYDLFLRMMNVGWNIRYVDRPLGVFRIHPSSKTRSQLNDVGLREINKLRVRYGRAPLDLAAWTDLTREVRQRHYGPLKLFIYRVKVSLFNRFLVRFFA